MLPAMTDDGPPRARWLRVVRPFDWLDANKNVLFVRRGTTLPPPYLDTSTQLVIRQRLLFGCGVRGVQAVEQPVNQTDFRQCATPAEPHAGPWDCPLVGLNLFTQCSASGRTGASACEPAEAMDDADPAAQRQERSGNLRQFARTRNQPRCGGTPYGTSGAGVRLSG